MAMPFFSKAGINVHHTYMPTPKETRAQIDAIIRRKVTQRRRIKSYLVLLVTGFFGPLTQAYGEDDCIFHEPFYHALSSMDHRENLAFQRKAGYRVSNSIPAHLYAQLHL